MQRIKGVQKTLMTLRMPRTRRNKVTLAQTWVWGYWVMVVMRMMIRMSTGCIIFATLSIRFGELGGSSNLDSGTGTGKA